MSLEWSAPSGFLTFDIAEVTDEWIGDTVAALCSEEDAVAFRPELLQALAWCLRQDSAPTAWHVLVGHAEGDRPRVLGAGWFDFREPLDLEELASGWRAQLAETEARGEVRVVDSKRAPMAVLRQISLEHAEDGGERYVEQARLLKLFRRQGVTGVLTLVTANIAAFDDMVAFLLEAADDFVVEEARVG